MVLNLQKLQKIVAFSLQIQSTLFQSANVLKAGYQFFESKIVNSFVKTVSPAIFQKTMHLVKESGAPASKTLCLVSEVTNQACVAEG